MVELTEGTPWKKLTLFALPIAIGRLFQALYSVVDTKIVGILLGQSALAAVSSVSTLCHLLNGFLDGTALGCSIIIAMYEGRRDTDHLKHSFAISIVIAILIAAGLTGILVPNLSYTLNLLKVPGDEQEMAGSYLRIMLLGLIVTSFNCLLSNVLRAIGDSLTPLVALGMSTAANIILDYVFVGTMHFGVGGAASATILAQFLSVILCAARIYWRTPVLHLKMRYFAFDSRLFADLLKSGMAMGFQSCIVNIGTVALQMSINAMGTAIIVAHTSARRVFELAYIPYASLGFALATYTAVNYGAHRTERIWAGFTASIQIIFIWSIAVTAIGEFFPAYLIRYMASSGTAEIIKWGSRYLRVEMPAMMLCGLVVLTRNLLQGIGNRLAPVISSVLELVIKIFCAAVSLRILHYWGIIIAEPLSWLMMSFVLLRSLHRSRAKLHISKDDKF